MIRIRGLEGVLRQIAQYQSNYHGKVKNEVIATAYEVEANAKTDVPVDEGTLRASIRAEIKPNGLKAVISAGSQQAPYAPYIEFGTGGEVVVPAGWENVASSFKGKTGKVVNRVAKPYLIPNAVKGAEMLQERIKNIKV